MGRDIPEHPETWIWRTLADPYLVLRDGNGTFMEQDDNGGTDVDASISFTPETSGTYWMEVRSFGTDPAGTYTVSAAEAGSATPPGGGDGESSPVVEEETDFAANTSSTGTFSDGETVEGELAASNDIDWVSIELTAGQVYTFDLTGADSGDGTLADPFLVLRDANGNFVDQDDDGGSGSNAHITFTPSTSGTYWLDARAAAGETGTYALRATVMDETSDFAGNTTSVGSVAVGEDTTGTFSSSSDRDWISVQLIAGDSYTFDLEGEGTGRGTLLDPFLILRDSNGTFISQDDDSGILINSQITYTPSTSGTYWLDARAADNGTGTYTLSAALTSDDYGNDISSNGSVQAGSSVTGNLETDSDRDWFSVQLTAGQDYTFNLEGADTDGGTLLNPVLSLRQENGVFINQDDDGGTLLNSQITYTPTTSGTYWLDARSSDNDPGTYTLSVATVGSSPPADGGDGGDDGGDGDDGDDNGGSGGGGSDDNGGNDDGGSGSDPVPADDYLGTPAAVGPWPSAARSTATLRRPATGIGSVSNL